MLENWRKTVVVMSVRGCKRLETLLSFEVKPISKNHYFFMFYFQKKIFYYSSNNPFRDLKKRELILADDSEGGSSISLTLWGRMAVDFNHNNRVIALKGAKVRNGLEILFCLFTGLTKYGETSMTT